MSTISPHHHHRHHHHLLLLLLLFLLCVSSFHACTAARSLGATDQQREKTFVPPNKSTSKVLSAAQGKVGYGHSLVKQSRVREDDRRQPVVSSSSAAKDQLGLRVSGALRHPLRVDSSHCVAHCRKPDEEKPGFNADYSVPRTHPPVHN